MIAVIMAGGRGSRISSIAKDIPKPLLKIGEKPVLEHELECLRDQGFRDVIITVGYLGQMIMDYFGDGSGISPVTAKPFGVRIQYYFEKEPLGNAGALYKIKDKLTDDFLLLNADSLFDVDFNRFVEAHKAYGGLATLLTHPNTHPADSGLIVSDNRNAVVDWLTKEDERPVFYKNRVNAGLHVLSPKLLQTVPSAEKVDLDRNILKPLAGTGKLYCYDTPEYVKDMGTPERYREVNKDYESGLIKAKNLRNKQKAVFLDRDGTINKYVGFLKRIDDFELIPGVAKAIRSINQSGYLAIVATNQPVIARGDISVDQLQRIHEKMETLLGEEGAYLDGIYYCPHHPQGGFPGEIPKLKIDCNCRKPKPGLLIKAAEDLNIDLSKSWMIGDGERDVLAGKAAGCKTALIGSGSYGQDMSVLSLEEFICKLNMPQKRVNEKPFDILRG